MSSTSFDPPNLLEPLQDFPLLTPFPEDLELSRAPLLGLYHDPVNAPGPASDPFLTPLPSHLSGRDLPLPDVHAPLDVGGVADPVVGDDTLIPPPAPRLKDLDSFSDGTALGSFNYSLASEHDIPPSVAFSPANPMRSIETWRTDVQRCLLEEEEEARYRVAQALSGRRLPTPEEPATKRRRVSELPFVNTVIEPFLRTVASRVAEARPPDGLDDGGAHIQGGRVEQGPRTTPPAMTIIRPSSAPPGTDVG